MSGFSYVYAAANGSEQAEHTFQRVKDHYQALMGATGCAGMVVGKVDVALVEPQNGSPTWTDLDALKHAQQAARANGPALAYSVTPKEAQRRFLFAGRSTEEND